MRYPNSTRIWYYSYYKKERPKLTTEGVDLETQIELLVNLGERDPLTITHKLIERYGEHWAQNEVALRAEEFITDLARRRLGNVRRRAELAATSGSETSAAQIRAAKFWIPDQGYKSGAELTSSDFRARAAFCNQLAEHIQKRAIWYREIADLMDAEGAAVFRDLQAPIPPMLGGEGILELTT